MVGAALFSLMADVQADSAKLVNPANGHAYQRFDSNKTWANARTACASTGGYLATITSQAENAWIVSNNLHNQYTWLGGTDEAKEGTWVWITGEPWSYTNWSSGEPNNDNNEDYLQFWAPAGTWNDTKGNEVNRYLCEWNLPTGKQSPTVGATANGFTGSVTVNCQNTVSGQTVQFSKKSNQLLNCTAAGLTIASGNQVTVKITGITAPFASHQYELKTDCGGWFACKGIAESLGGHLVTIGTKEEQAFVYNKFKGAGDFWMGLSDYITEGAFQWVNGAPLNYTYWDVTQPDNFGNAEDCAVVLPTGKWNDANCDLSLPAVIEYE